MSLLVVGTHAQNDDVDNQVEGYFIVTDEGVIRKIEFGQTGTSTFNGDIIIQAKPVEHEGVYQLSENLYLSNAYDNIYTLSERIDIDTYSFSTTSQQFKNHEIPQNLLDDINDTIRIQNEIENDDFSVSIYVPSSYSTFASSNGTEYTYNGQRYKHYTVEYSNMSTNMIDHKGKSASTVADSIVNFVISAVGVSILTVGIFGAGKSAFDMFKAIYGTDIVGTSNDIVQTNIIYNKTSKETLWYNPYSRIWEDGCMSFRVRITRADTYQYYASTGDSHLIKTTLNTWYYSENYNNLQSGMDYAGLMYVDSPIYLTLYNYRVKL